jgi:hypothetical protein
MVSDILKEKGTYVYPQQTPRVQPPALPAFFRQYAKRNKDVK